MFFPKTFSEVCTFKMNRDEMKGDEGEINVACIFSVSASLQAFLELF